MADELGVGLDESSLSLVVRDLVKFLRGSQLVSPTEALRIWSSADSVPATAGEAIEMLKSTGTITAAQAVALANAFIDAQRVRLEEMLRVVGRDGNSSTEHAWTALSAVQAFDAEALTTDPISYLIFEGLLTTEQVDAFMASRLEPSVSRIDEVAAPPAVRGTVARVAAHDDGDSTTSSTQANSTTNYGPIFGVVIFLMLFSFWVGYRVGIPPENPEWRDIHPSSLPVGRGSVPWPTSLNMETMTRPNWMVGEWRCRDEDEHMIYTYRLSDSGFVGMGGHHWGVPWSHPNILYIGQPIQPAPNGSMYMLTLRPDRAADWERLGPRGPDGVVLSCTHVSSDGAINAD